MFCVVIGLALKLYRACTLRKSDGMCIIQTTSARVPCLLLCCHRLAIVLNLLLIYCARTAVICGRLSDERIYESLCMTLLFINAVVHGSALAPEWNSLRPCVSRELLTTKINARRLESGHVKIRCRRLTMRQTGDARYQ